jgi:YD repeat-containing protein
MRLSSIIVDVRLAVMLSIVRDRHGNQTRYIYNTAGKLSQIIDPVNLTTNFAYTGDRVTSITDPANRVTRLAYDTAGNLTFPVIFLF